ncbi:exported hypothetical protein [Bradyrhizobium sp. STM 3843]|nr:exported hypothetical protein [Bradyrhizobium sp. STM 3843]
MTATSNIGCALRPTSLAHAGPSQRPSHTKKIPSPLAGEGAERSEAGEGYATAITEPSDDLQTDSRLRQGDARSAD